MITWRVHLSHSFQTSEATFRPIWESKKSSEIVTFSVGLGGKEMGGDQQLDKGEQNQCSHKQKGRTKRKNPLQHCCCLRLFGGDDTVGDQGAPHKGRLHYFHCSWNNSFLIAIPE